MKNTEHSRSMQELKPTIWIGKLGCTGEIIDEITQQLRKRKLVKVKWLHNTEIDPAVLAEECGAELVEVRGRTVVLAERSKKF